MTADSHAFQEYKIMRVKSYLSTEHINDPQNKLLTVTLCNIRSISKHLIDLLYDKKLRKKDLICPTETQMIQRSETEISSKLQESEIIYITNVDKYFKVWHFV